MQAQVKYLCVEDRGMAREIVTGHEQQKLNASQQLQASTNYHVSCLLHMCYSQT